jgi:hypothetical protein
VIRIEIDNDDNPPLKIDNVTGYQLNRYLLAYLESRKKYQLFFVDSLASVPLYDLRFFNDSINVKTLIAGPIERNTTASAIQEKATNNNKWLLWGSILPILIILLVLSTGLIKEINKNGDMIIYNVTIKITWPIQKEWLAWYKDEHIPEVMQTGCFTKYQMVQLLETDEMEGPTYAIQYYADTKEDYEKYISDFAPAMRQKLVDKWGDQFIAFRSLMRLVQ